MKRLIAYLGIFFSIILGGILGLTAALVWTFDVLKAYLDTGYLLIGIALGAFIGGVLAFMRVRLYFKEQQIEKGLAKHLTNVPANAANLIRAIIGQMGYRKKVRADVMAELIAHFEDELRDCKGDDEKEQRAQKLIEDFGDAKLLAVLLRRAKKRCRPLWRTVVARTFQTIGVLILCFIVYVGWFLAGRPVVTVDYVAELNRMVRPVADETLNAAPLYEKAVELYEEKSSDEMSELLGKKYNEATNEQKQLIEQWLEDNDEIFDLVVAGTNKPYCWREYKEAEGSEGLMSVLLPHLSEFRRLAYALRWRIWLSTERNRYEDSFNDIKTCYRLGQHVKGNFILIEQLVGIAIESLAVHTLRDILSRHEIDSAMLATLQEEFQQITNNEDFIISLKTEKLFMYDETQRCFTKDRLGGGHLYIPRVTGLGGDIPTKLDDIVLEVVLSPQQWLGAAKILFLHPNKQQTREAGERFYAWAETIVNQSPCQIRGKGIDIEQEAMKIIGGNLLLEVLCPAVWKINQINYRNKIDVQATLAIIAILRYKLDKGDYPDSLDKLTESGYLKQVPIDPYSDKPLVYKKIDGDFILYGVGLNFTDDGGEVYRDDEGRVRLWGDVGDWVFWPVQK